MSLKSKIMGTTYKTSERQRAYARKWRANNLARETKELFKKNNAKLHKSGYYRLYNQKKRAIVLTAYGGECRCCGEREIKFLSIDHINGGGTKHRKEIKGATYSWLIKNKFPSGFQLLCHNCNMAKALYGKCPHLQETNAKS